MFGYNEDGQQTGAQSTQTSNDNSVVTPAYDTGTVVQEPAAPSSSLEEAATSEVEGTSSIATTPTENPINPIQSAPVLPTENTDDSDDDVISSLPEPTGSPLIPSAVTVSDDLAELKQKALQDLTPLVNQLEQTPEEKFRTTMMMIQASDNKSLLPDAYTAAQAITDEKARAQALLDVINEINYFTQNS
jgi:hypothetical protein